MAKFVYVGNQKGGVGKSALSCMLAAALSQAPFNFRVLVIDLDKQESLLRLRALDIEAYKDTEFATLKLFDIVKMENVAELPALMGQLDKTFDFVFFDAGGRLDNNITAKNQIITPLLMLCDVLFVPVVAGNFAFNSASEFLTHAAKIQDTRKNNIRPLRIGSFINMLEDGQAGKELLDELKAISLNLPSVVRFPCDLRNYQTYRKADTVVSQYNDYKTAPALLFKKFVTDFLTFVN